MQEEFKRNEEVSDRLTQEVFRNGFKGASALAFGSIWLSIFGSDGESGADGDTQSKPVTTESLLERLRIQKLAWKIFFVAEFISASVSLLIYLINGANEGI